jgi:hypothetical protein
MNTRFVNKQLQDLFEVKSGNYHAVNELDLGQTPLVSCGDIDNGVIGYYDIPDDKTYSYCLTSAYNGQPLTTKYHPYTFGAKDDVAVLLPRSEMRETTLLYIAGLLNAMRWRYSYGRKCFNAKMKRLVISVPVIDMAGKDLIDEDYISALFERDLASYIPEKSIKPQVSLPLINWTYFPITKIFSLKRGDFHSLTALELGEYPTVSRSASNNGIVGYFEKPDDAKIYKRGHITVSTVGGDAFVQLDDFIATDNVVICTPKFEIKMTSLIFIAFMINQQKWRYSYGRQAYINKLAQVKLALPINSTGNLDEEAIALFVQQSPYWSYFEECMTKFE